MLLIAKLKDKALVELKRRNKNVIVTKKLTNYIEDLSNTGFDTKYIEEYKRITSLPSGSYQTPLSEIRFLNLLISSVDAKTILEVGTYKGFTAMLFANTSPSCHVTTCELNTENAKEAQTLWEHYGFSDRITLIEGKATDSMDSLISQEAKFDFVYIDANKNQYPEYVEKAMALVRKGGLIVVDNALWAGLVAEKDTQYSHAKILNTLNKEVFKNFKDVTLIPAWDGILIIKL
jgi:O-methyltransferase